MLILECRDPGDHVDALRVETVYERRQIEAGDTGPQPADQWAFGFEDHRAGVVLDVDDDAVDFGGLRERDRLAQAAGRRRAPRRQINRSNGAQPIPGPDGTAGLGPGNLRPEHGG